MKNHNIYFSSIGNHVISHLALEIKIPLVCEGKKRENSLGADWTKLNLILLKG